MEDRKVKDEFWPPVEETEIDHPFQIIYFGYYPDVLADFSGMDEDWVVNKYSLYDEIHIHRDNKGFDAWGLVY